MNKLKLIYKNLKFVLKTNLDLQSCLDIFPEKVQKNKKSYEFHVFKRKEGYMIDYHTDGNACFFACGKDLYQTADHMLQILKYHKII